MTIRCHDAQGQQKGNFLQKKELLYPYPSDIGFQ